MLSIQNTTDTEHFRLYVNSLGRDRKEKFLGCAVVKSSGLRAIK